ncbi:MAG TPA: tetratricopeptide repeat protein, partial [Pyrinomonadaceae bacterium]|nr:tetratricopeptide repeat protein [Pyrinomonadaceae bacterium]
MNLRTQPDKLMRWTALLCLLLLVAPFSPAVHSVHSEAVIQFDGQQENLRTELQQYLSALEAARRASDRAEELNALVYVALTYEKLREHQSAINYYNEALKLLPAINGRRAAVLYGLGDNYKSLRSYAEALNYFNEAVRIWQGEKTSDMEAQAQVEIGDIYRLLGDFGEAMKRFQRARSLYQSVNDSKAEASVLAVMGSVATTHREMLLYYNQSLQIWEGLQSYEDVATILSGLGTIYSDFDDRESLRYLELARAAWHKVPNDLEEAKILLDIGLAHVWLNETAKALDSYAEALKLWTALRDRHGQAETLTRLGWTYYWSGDQGRALENLIRAAALLVDEPAKAAVPLGHVAIIYARLDEKQKALETIRQVIAVSNGLNSFYPVKSLLLYDIGLVHHLTGDRQKAFSYWNQEVELYRLRADSRGEADALFTIAMAYELEGDLKTSLTYYLRSLDARDKVRTAAGVEELKIRLAEKSADAYQRAMLLQLRLDQQSVDAFRLSERARSRTFLDQIGNARLGVSSGGDSPLVLREVTLRQQISDLSGELQKRVMENYDERELQTLTEQLAAQRREYERTLRDLKLENPAYASLHEVDVLGASEVRALLEPDTTILSFMVTSEKTIAFVVARDKYKVVELNVREQELFEAVNEVRVGNAAALVQLYTRLIAPLRNDLQTPRVGIIPHGVLHYLPFS